MFLIRIIIVIALFLAIVPLINKAIDYFQDKSQKVKIIGKTAKQIWKNNN
jgi:hypothetical protein